MCITTHVGISLAEAFSYCSIFPSKLSEPQMTRSRSGRGKQISEPILTRKRCCFTFEAEEVRHISFQPSHCRFSFVFILHQKQYHIMISNSKILLRKIRKQKDWNIRLLMTMKPDRSTFEKWPTEGSFAKDRKEFYLLLQGTDDCKEISFNI